MWPNLQETADTVTFTGEILNGKLHFLCSQLFLCNELFIFVQWTSVESIQINGNGLTCKGHEFLPSNVYS